VTHSSPRVLPHRVPGLPPARRPMQEPLPPALHLITPANGCEPKAHRTATVRVQVRTFPSQTNTPHGVIQWHLPVARPRLTITRPIRLGGHNNQRARDRLPVAPQETWSSRSPPRPIVPPLIRPHRPRRLPRPPPPKPPARPAAKSRHGRAKFRPHTPPFALRNTQPTSSAAATRARAAIPRKSITNPDHPRWT